MKVKAERILEADEEYDFELGDSLRLRVESLQFPSLAHQQLLNSKIKIRPLGVSSSYLDSFPDDLELEVKLDDMGGDSYEGTVSHVQHILHGGAGQFSVYDLELEVPDPQPELLTDTEIDKPKSSQEEITLIYIPGPNDTKGTYFIECADFTLAWLTMRKVLPINQDEIFWYSDKKKPPYTVRFNEAPVTPSEDTLNDIRDLGGHIFGGTEPVNIEIPSGQISTDLEKAARQRDSARLSWVTTQIYFEDIINAIVKGAKNAEKNKKPIPEKYGMAEYYVRKHWGEKIKAKLKSIYGKVDDDKYQYAVYVIAHEARTYWLEREFNRAKNENAINLSQNIFPPNTELGVFISVEDARSSIPDVLTGDLSWFGIKTKERESAKSGELQKAFADKVLELMERYKTVTEPRQLLYQRTFDVFQEEFLKEQKVKESAATPTEAYEIRAAGEIILKEQFERLSNMCLNSIFLLEVDGSKTFGEVLVEEYNAERKKILRPDLKEVSEVIKVYAPNLWSMFQAADKVIRDSKKSEMPERLSNMHEQWDKIEAYLITALKGQRNYLTRIENIKDEFFYLYSMDFLFDKKGKLTPYGYKMWALSQVNSIGRLFNSFNNKRHSGSDLNQSANIELASQVWATLNFLERILVTPETQRDKWTDFERGFASLITWERIPFGRSMGSALESQTLTEAGEMYNKGGALSPVQDALLASYGAFLQTAQDANPSSSYNVGRMVAETIAPILEYVMTAGPATLLGAGAGGLVAGELSALGFTVLSGFVGSLTTIMVASTVQTLMDPMELYANTLQYMRPMSQLTYDSETGQLVTAAVIEGESAGTAFYYGFVDAWTEMFTERLGGRVTAGGTKLLTSLFARGAKRTIFLKGLNYAGKMLSVTGWHGPVGEYEEELWQQVLSSILKGKQIHLEWKEQLEIFATCAIVGAPMVAAQTTFAGYQVSRTFYNSKSGQTIVLPMEVYLEMLTLNNQQQIDSFVESLAERNLTPEQLALVKDLATVLAEKLGSTLQINREAAAEMSDQEAKESLNIQVQILKSLLAARAELLSEEQSSKDEQVRTLTIEVDGEVLNFVNFKNVGELDYHIGETLKAVAILMDRVHQTDLAGNADLSIELLFAEIELLDISNSLSGENVEFFAALRRVSNATDLLAWIHMVRRGTNFDESMTALRNLNKDNLDTDEFAGNLMSQTADTVAMKLDFEAGVEIDTEIDGHTVKIRKISITGLQDMVAEGIISEATAANLIQAMKDLESDDVAVRTKAIRDLRNGFGDKANRNASTAGAVNLGFLEAHVQAIEMLNGMMATLLESQNIEGVVALDRGGTHLLLQLQTLTESGIGIKLIDKPTDDQHGQQLGELREYLEKRAQENPNGRVIFVETFVSGSSTWGAIDKVFAKFLKDNPGFTIDIVVLRQTSQLEEGDYVSAEEAIRNKGKKRKLKVRNQLLDSGQLNVYSANVPYIVGEDVDPQVNRKANSQEPVIVFEVKGDKVNGLIITPTGKTTLQEVMLGIGKGKAKGKLGTLY